MQNKILLKYNYDLKHENNLIKMQLMSIWNAWMMILNIKIFH